MMNNNSLLEVGDVIQTGGRNAAICLYKGRKMVY